jgi:hypothetical protein
MPQGNNSFVIFTYSPCYNLNGVYIGNIWCHFSRNGSVLLQIDVDHENGGMELNQDFLVNPLVVISLPYIPNKNVTVFSRHTRVKERDNITR